MKPAAARMDFVTFNNLDVVGRDAQQPLPDATQSASGRHFVADLRQSYVARVRRVSPQFTGFVGASI